MSKVYLAGAIFDRTDEEVHGWRQTATALLAPIEVRNPALRDYRGRTHLEEVRRAIVERDKRDIAACDAILVHWEGTGSVGTTMEIIFAHMLDIPVHLVLAIGLDADHLRRLSPWLIYHATMIHGSLEAACSHLRLTLTPQPGLPLA